MVQCLYRQRTFSASMATTVQTDLVQVLKVDGHGFGGRGYGDCGLFDPIPLFPEQVHCRYSAKHFGCSPEFDNVR